ncbi:MAG: helix-turn-helix domain-containing protein [Alphaproteobacteria bacterium]|nr:helix-turn-helix domain-containing protein [Alphaproteobacteria bacterium]
MDEPVPAQKHFEYYTDMPVGEILRRARLHYGQTLEDIERALRIRAVQLEAIETGNVERLPGRVYAIGFVRSYSEYLGLDGDQMVQLFKSQSLDAKAAPELHFPAPASESKIPGPWVIASSIAGLVLVFVLWSFLSGGKGEPETSVPPVPQEVRAQVSDLPAVDPNAIRMTHGDPVSSQVEDPAVAPEQPVPQVEEPPAEPEAADVPPIDPEHRVIIEVTERSWVEIRDRQGRIILSRVLPAGNSYFVPRDREDLLLATGNAGGLVVTVDGEPMPSFGQAGEVRRNIPLSADALKNMLEMQRR